MSLLMPWQELVRIPTTLVLTVHNFNIKRVGRGIAEFVGMSPQIQYLISSSEVIVALSLTLRSSVLRSMIICQCSRQHSGQP